jgi:hypothetical protein
MKPKDIILLIVGFLCLVAGAFLMVDFLKTFLPFVIGIVLIVVGLHLVFRIK